MLLELYLSQMSLLTAFQYACIGFHAPNGNRLPGISENIQLNVVPITWMFLQIPEHTLTFRDLFTLEQETNLCEV